MKRNVLTRTAVPTGFGKVGEPGRAVVKRAVTICKEDIPPDCDELIVIIEDAVEAA